MVNKIIISLSLVFSLLISGSSQDFNCNQIKNWNFQSGGYPCGVVHSPSWHPQYQEYSFDGVISNWVIANQSPDWVDINQQKTIDYYSSLGVFVNQDNFPSNRFISFGAEEAFRQTLYKPLTSDRTFQLRIKTASFADYDLRLCVNAHFTKWGEHWDANSNNNNKQVIGPFCSYGSLYFPNWTEEVINFNVSNSNNNELKNITIKVASEGGGYGPIRLIDDIELYEYCPETFLFENQRFSYVSPAPYEGYRIFAGYDVGQTVLGNGNVVIGSTADITFKGVYDVVLEPGFETEAGAEFLAYTAPCGATEFPLPQPFETSICLEPNDPTVLTLGTQYNPTYHYEWTPHDYLTNPYGMQTDLVIPLSTFTTDGSLVYYLHVYDDQNNEVQPPTPFIVNYTLGLELLWIPNAFVPDGVNTTFYAYTRGVDYYEFYIFAKPEGDLISSGHINTPSPQKLDLWDGYYQGQMIPLTNVAYRLDLYNTCGQYEWVFGDVTVVKSSFNNRSSTDYDYKSIRAQYYTNVMGQIIYDINSVSTGIYFEYTEYTDGTTDCKKIFINGED